MQLLLGDHGLLWDVGIVVLVRVTAQIDVFGGVENVLDQPRKALERVGLHQLLGAQLFTAAGRDLALEPLEPALLRVLSGRHLRRSRFLLARRLVPTLLSLCFRLFLVHLFFVFIAPFLVIFVVIGARLFLVRRTPAAVTPRRSARSIQRKPSISVHVSSLSQVNIIQ